MRRLRDGVLALADVTDDRALRDGAAARDEIAPSWSSVTAYPSAVWIVTARPPAGTGPTNETAPAAGARTGSPAAAPMSIPAVLAGRVLVRGERERPQHRSVGGPDPAGRDRDDDQGRDRSDDRDGEHAPHEVPPS